MRTNVRAAAAWASCLDWQAGCVQWCGSVWECTGRAYISKRGRGDGTTVRLRLGALLWRQLTENSLPLPHTHLLHCVICHNLLECVWPHAECAAPFTVANDQAIRFQGKSWSQLVLRFLGSRPTDGRCHTHAPYCSTALASMVYCVPPEGLKLTPWYSSLPPCHWP